MQNSYINYDYNGEKKAANKCSKRQRLFPSILEWDCLRTCNRAHVHRRKAFDDDDHRCLHGVRLAYTRILDHWSVRKFQSLFSAIRDRAAVSLGMLAFVQHNTMALELIITILIETDSTVLI